MADAVYGRISPSVEARFWAKVDCINPAGPNGDCWEWTASKPRGYGDFSINNKSYRANRLSLAIKLRRDLHVGMNALHSCDNPACVNPAHLREGTISDNMKDAYSRGRIKPQNMFCPLEKQLRGTERKAAKLDEDKVREIRRSGSPIRALAREYGVSRKAISLIRNRVNWKHVAD